MPKGCLIGHIDVADAESYKAYQQKVPAIIKARRTGLSKLRQSASNGALIAVAGLDEQPN